MINVGVIHSHTVIVIHLAIAITDLPEDNNGMEKIGLVDTARRSDRSLMAKVGFSTTYQKAVFSLQERIT